MSKIDEVSEAIGELRSDIKDTRYYIENKIGSDVNKIEKHLKVQNSRIKKSEDCISSIKKENAVFRAKVLAWGAGAGAVTGFFVAILHYFL